MRIMICHRTDQTRARGSAHQNSWARSAERFALIAAAYVLVLAFAQSTSAQSSRPGMGSTPYADALGTGVTFRVWAPNATTVAVPGVFNGWNTTANYLVKEGSSGLWSADVPAARPNDQYKYQMN